VSREDRLSTENAGYQRPKLWMRSPLRVRVRVWKSRCAPSGVHCIDCFLTKRLLSSELTSNATKAVETTWPARPRRASFGARPPFRHR
jgi:hypothetical protein